MHRLLAPGSASKEEWDDVRFEAATLAARLSEARHRLSELSEGTRAERLAAQRARVDELVAEVRGISLRLEDMEIRAPFPGTVSRRSVDEGAVIRAGAPVYTLLETDAVELRVGVPVEEIIDLPAGARVGLETRTSSFEARVRTVLPTVDPATRVAASSTSIDS